MIEEREKGKERKSNERGERKKIKISNRKLQQHYKYTHLL